MSTGQPTEREAALLARIQELEAAAQKTTLSVAQGGVVEGLWRTATSIVPPWLVAIAVAAFLGHHGFGYFIDAQIQQAQTQQAQAKADLTAALAKAENEPANGEISRKLATAKAEVAKLQAEAAGARASAQAVSATLNGETMALQTAKAQLAKTQNEGTALRAQADAANARFGSDTLEQRAKKAKYITQVMEAIESKAEAALRSSPNNVAVMGRNELTALCADNPYADLIGCPASFIPAKPKLGVEVKDGSDGVHITKVIPGSPAEAAQLTPLHVITALDGRAVTSASQFVAAIQKHPSGSAVRLTFMFCIGACSDPETKTITLQ